MSTQTEFHFDSAGPGASATWARAPGRILKTLRCDSPHHHAILSEGHRILKTWSSPLEAMEWLGREGRAQTWFGWLSYDLGRYFEAVPRIADDDLHVPLFVFTSHESPSHESAEPNSPAKPCVSDRCEVGDIRSTFSRQAYEKVVAKVIEFIRAGDIFQVNLSQRFTVQSNRTPAEIYRNLRAKTPAAYGALLQYDDFALICNSPELFLRVTPDRKIVTRPIKGTRPRGEGMEMQLRNSAKDQAELNMIVDLERNDLGRVCEIGSVRVVEPRAIEAHPTVYHGVATIEGTLRSEITFLDLLRATFPGGSVTGAPKIRAMEIIEQLEPVRRGPYCGAIGRLDPDGGLEFNLAIRTMIAKGNEFHIPVGGGIVADSQPPAEYDETLVKARAMFEALGINAPGHETSTASN